MQSGRVVYPRCLACSLCVLCVFVVNFFLASPAQSLRYKVMPDWDEKYSRGHHTTREPSHLLRRALKRLKPGHALDIACGVGRHTLFLAQRAWEVIAIDSSRVAIEILQKRALDSGLVIDARVADLERGEFEIKPERFDLICDFYYLQRDLFPQIRAGVKTGGTIVAAIHIIDEDPASRLANPAFSLEPGELRAEFHDWEIEYYHEGQPHDRDHHRRTAEIIARKLLQTTKAGMSFKFQVSSFRFD